MNKRFILTFILVIVILSGCVERSPTLQPPILETSPTQILISEIFTGVEGNNQADFIELYNTGSEIADLDGYQLWYQLHDEADPVILYTWNETTLIPPRGYYALTQEGQLFGVEADQHFNQALVPNRGGLSIQREGEIDDQISWGSGPSNFVEGQAAPEIVSGSSLQRSPEALRSGGGDEDNNILDFSLNASPSLMNTGSPLNHDLAEQLTFSLDIPYQVKPGETFEIGYQIQNLTNVDLEGLEIFIPLPEYISLEENHGLFTSDDSILTAQLPRLESESELNGTISLQAEWTFSKYTFQNLYIKAVNWDLPAFNPPFKGEIGGAAIPISTARELVDKEVVVEGTSTMYVGGFYAGSGAKFYLEDVSGGIQVYVSGAGNSLVVPLGSTVRVRGKIEIYRDSVELIPASEDQVEILEAGGESSYHPAYEITIEDINKQPGDLPGKLLAVEGRVARAEEYSYSYEMDLFDEIGNLVTLYIDKETGISIEEVETGQHYQISGIMELYDGRLRLYPRLQSDLARIYPPGLYIQAKTPTTASPGEIFEVQIQVINRAPERDTNLIVQVPLDPQLEVLNIGTVGKIENGSIVWQIPALEGNDQTLDLSFQARMRSGMNYALFKEYQVVSDSYPQAAFGNESYTFSGETVPIWAVQGPADRSPFILSRLTTQGVVTGIFPELEGFWMQERDSDYDPATSPGLFIRTGAKLPEIKRGDLVSVTGRVREVFQQTEIEVNSLSNIEVIGSSSLPIPFTLDPPTDEELSLAYFESLEGCLVTVPGSAIVVGPTTRYGEFAIVLNKHGIGRAWQGSENGLLIHADDGSNQTYEVRDDQEVAVGVGDAVNGLTGVLAYTYGNYKIEPTGPFQVQKREPIAPVIDPLSSGQFSIMTWNVENLFDFLVPHPSSPPLPSVSEYKWQINRVAQTIQAAGFPTVIGFQEVETLEILEDIAQDPILGPFDYHASLIEGTDSRGIDVGYLVRGDMASLIGETQYPAPGNITSRPPLLIEVDLFDSSGQTLYLLNNHFTSMSGGEEATEPRRNAQAAWNAEIASELLSENPDALVAVIGDLNSFYDSLPLQTLEEIGLINLFDHLEPEERYTYVYQGLSQVLDHILVSPALDAYLVDVEVLHSNADFPLPSSGDSGYLRKSDHDPVIGIFILP